MPIADALPSSRLPAPLANAIHRLLQIDRLDDLYTTAAAQPGQFVPELLRLLRITVKVEPRDLARVPRTGPAVVVCNHPSGMLDGTVLLHVLTGIRSDVRVLTNRMLGAFPALHDTCIFVDAFNSADKRSANGFALKAALKHLRAGGLLVVFPAGEVSHFDLRARAVRDPAWNPAAARLIELSGARAVPMFIQGHNGLPFQMLGMLHPRLRTAALPAELLNKTDRVYDVRIGAPVEAIALTPRGCESAIRYLRLRSELLGRRSSPLRSALKKAAPLASPVDEEDILRELHSLPAHARLQEAGDLQVYIANATAIPRTLLEIGRLREITFREAGEGTGEARDLDRHDEHYLHLFAWDSRHRRIVGAYRLGDVERLLAKFGSRGLYTTSLFHFAPGFLEGLGPALELGRSFVRPEYQKQFAPLLLLWKGICAHISRNPRHSTLIGAVSISGNYSPASRELIAGYFEGRHRVKPWDAPVRPRRRLHGRTLPKWEAESLASLFTTTDQLSAPIGDLEPDGKGLPVLLRQYAKLGGELLAFSIDRQFSDTLDGFVLVDLKKTNRDTLARYMGREAVAEFLRQTETDPPLRLNARLFATHAERYPVISGGGSKF